MDEQADAEHPRRGRKPSASGEPEPAEAPEPEAFSETRKSQDFEDEMKALEDSGEDTDELRRQYLLRRFWQTAAGFWSKRGQRIAWVLSIALFVIILLNIAASYGMNLWNRAIFDALEKKDANTVLFLSLIYFAILAASVAVSVTQVYAA